MQQLLSPRLLAHPFHLLKVLLMLPLAGRAQGYAEGVSLSYERMSLHLKTPDKPVFHVEVYRASAIVPVALKRFKSSSSST